MSDDFSPQDFGRAFKRFLEWSLEELGDEDQPAFSRLLTDHFGADPTTYPISSKTIPAYDRPNLQLALEAYLAEEGREHTLVGFSGTPDMIDVTLASLVGKGSFFEHLDLGPVRRTPVTLDGDRVLSCIASGLFLVRAGDARLAIRVGTSDRHFGGQDLTLEVMARSERDGQEAIAHLRRLMHEHNVYRGRMLALAGGSIHDDDEGLGVEFLKRPSTARDEIVLPDGLLETVELHTIEFSRVQERLVAGGRHVRRGLLLHGPPGTGKTLTTGYVASRLADRTVLLLTGSALGAIGAACDLARSLQPSVVVLEDIDLIASERGMMGMGETSLLFELLNQMDGMGEDADVVFLMTTNRVDRLEPALAARPGRVDQAIELPLPDAAGRAQLLSLFCAGLDVELAGSERVVERTEGASPAFLRELVRKAALHAAIADEEPVTDKHFAAALDALERGGTLTRRILGAEGAADVDLGDPDGGYVGGAFAIEDDEDLDQE